MKDSKFPGGTQNVVKCKMREFGGKMTGPLLGRSAFGVGGPKLGDEALTPSWR